MDFTDAASYRSGTVNRDWMNSWDPIGGIFNANLNGNGYTLHNLKINGVSTKDAAGLFHTIGAAGRVENLNIRNVTIEGLAGGEKVGGMAGENRGLIFNSRIINADIEGAGNQTLGVAVIGGMVGVNDGSDANVGSIEQSSVYGSVAARSFSTNALHIVGGLVGRNLNGAEVHNSHAVGFVLASCTAGGLVGEQDTTDRTNPDDISTIRNSYAVIAWDSPGGNCVGGLNALNVSGLASNNDSDIVNSYALFENKSSIVSPRISGFNTDNNGASLVTNSYWNSDLYSSNAGAGSSQSTVALQTSTGATGIYSQWSEEDWDFGTSSQYPTLRAADGSTATEIWDAGLLEDIAAENVAITEDFAALKFNYNLAVDGLQLPPQITFNTTTTRIDVNIEIYCDGVRCPLADPADPTTILFAATTPEEIRIVARQGNRVAEYRFAIVYDEYTLTNVDGISVDEGDTFTIQSNYSSSASVSILWTQTAGPSINVNNDTQLDLRLEPQADLVDRDADHSIVRFRLELSLNEQVYITREISARINKVNNGNNVTVALSQQDMQLRTISTVNNDPDGGSGAASSIIIQRRLSSEHAWAVVSSGSSGNYNLPAETSDYQYRAIHIYEDAQAYLESIASNIITVPGRQPDDGITANDSDGDSVLNADDIDDDNDGLIEIRFLEDLDAIRYQLDGKGYRASADAELITSGCPITGCIGYELSRSLNFDQSRSYHSRSVNGDWTVSDRNRLKVSDDSAWQPIDGAGSNPFNAIFNGNGNRITNLQINHSGDTFDDNGRSNIGLFARIGARGRVENLILVDPLIGGLNVSHNNNKNVGSIAGVMWPRQCHCQ